MAAIAGVLLLGSVAVALSTTVAGEDFERQGAVTEAGTAYTLRWLDGEPGKVRFALVAHEEAVAPRAQLSLFAPDGAHTSTFTLDPAWPQLDHLLASRGEHRLVVHETVDASVEVLSEAGHVATLEPTVLDEEQLTVVEGEHEALAYQLAIERPARDAHIGLALDGTASGLTVEAFNAEGESVLSAAAAAIDTGAGERLLTSTQPDRFTEGALLLRVSADTFNGSLLVTFARFADDTVRHSFTGLPLPFAPEAGEEDEEEADDDEADEGPDEADAREPEDGNTTVPDEIEGVTIADLERDLPVAFDAPAGLERVWVVAEQGCPTVATVFGPDDRIVASVEVHDSDDAVEWDRGLYGVAIDLPTSGEHVVLLSGVEEGFLFGEGLTVAPDARELDTQAIEAPLAVEDEERLLFIGTRSAVGEVVLPAGLIGVVVHAQGLDVDRRVSVVDEAGEEVYTSEGLTSPWRHEMGLTVGGASPVGHAGLYTVSVEATGVMASDVAVDLVTYLR